MPDQNSGKAMRFAYADPPYPGNGHRYPEKAEVDHGQLIRDLVDQFPDGWALSTSSPSLQPILAMCPVDVRVMAWVKPFAVFKPNVGVAYAWEPVIVRGGRRRAEVLSPERRSEIARIAANKRWGQSS